MLLLFFLEKMQFMNWITKDARINFIKYRTIRQRIQECNESTQRAGRLGEADIAKRFCHTAHPVRNTVFADEILRRECNSTALSRGVVRAGG
jgi:hypothetical protein